MGRSCSEEMEECVDLLSAWRGNLADGAVLASVLRFSSAPKGEERTVWDFLSPLTSPDDTTTRMTFPERYALSSNHLHTRDAGHASTDKHESAATHTDA